MRHIVCLKGSRPGVGGVGATQRASLWVFACNIGDLGLIPGLGRSPGEEKGYPLQYSGLENSMNYVAHGITKSQT